VTFEDMRVVEAHVADLHAGGLPVMLSTEYDRVDVDARALGACGTVTLVDRLAQSLGRKGYIWDVWVDGVSNPNNRMIHVAEREEAG
jgi:hypothetical protein